MVMIYRLRNNLFLTIIGRWFWLHRHKGEHEYQINFDVAGKEASQVWVAKFLSQLD
jgi:hypothetical protein